jgi:hypothetical protein
MLRAQTVILNHLRMALHAEGTQAITAQKREAQSGVVEFHYGNPPSYAMFSRRLRGCALRMRRCLSLVFSCILRTLVVGLGEPLFALWAEGPLRS